MALSRGYERTGKSPRRYDRYDDYDKTERHHSRAPRSRSRHRPRKRWPPPPKVETEREALAVEYRPVFSKYEEVQSKGSIDQQPIIMDAFPTISTRASHEPSNHGRRADLRRRVERNDALDSPKTKPTGQQGKPHFESSSSSESLGPKTPIDQNLSNLDRRYVFVPEKGTEIQLPMMNLANQSSEHLLRHQVKMFGAEKPSRHLESTHQEIHRPSDFPSANVPHCHIRLLRSRKTMTYQGRIDFQETIYFRQIS